MVASKDQWTAFVLSLAFPGSGQLWAQHRSCVYWFAGGAALMVLWAVAEENWGPIPFWFRVIAFLSLGFVSAEHARRVFAREHLS